MFACEGVEARIDGAARPRHEEVSPISHLFRFRARPLGRYTDDVAGTRRCPVFWLPCGALIHPDQMADFQMASRTGLGLLLRRYRATAGLSQEGLAARAGLSTRAISDLERGLHRAPHGDTLDRLAAALALSAQQHAVMLAAARPELDGAFTLPIPAAAPVAVSGAALARSLPLPPTALIGRAAERARAISILRDDGARLLTLTGPSGAGKTRLTLEIARD